MYHFKNLAKTGKFGHIYLTMHSDRVIELIGEPDYRGGQSNKYKWGNIWRYGDLELIFENGTRCLASISVNFNSVDLETEQGRNFTFNSWIFDSSLNLSKFQAIAENESIQLSR